MFFQSELLETVVRQRREGFQIAASAASFVLQGLREGYRGAQLSSVVPNPFHSSCDVPGKIALGVCWRHQRLGIMPVFQEMDF
jgi:hypothetical protein